MSTLDGMMRMLQRRSLTFCFMYSLSLTICGGRVLWLVFLFFFSGNGTAFFIFPFVLHNARDLGTCELSDVRECCHEGDLA